MTVHRQLVEERRANVERSELRKRRPAPVQRRVERRVREHRRQLEHDTLRAATRWLAVQIVRLLDDDELRARLGRAARIARRPRRRRDAPPPRGRHIARCSAIRTHPHTDARCGSTATVCRVGSNPRLLVATTDFPPTRGGIQRVLDELTHRLAERWTVTVIAPREDSSERFDATTPFQVVRTRAAWGESREAVLCEMTRLIARRRFDLLLAGHMNTLPAAFVAGRGAPAVGLIYGSELWAPWTRTVTRLLGRRLDRGMAISRFTATEAVRAGIPADRLVIAPLGASPPPAAGGSDEVLDRLGLRHEGRAVPFFLTVSRLSEPHKGHDVFLRALPAVLRRYPDARYVIAGGGPIAKDLSALAHALGIAYAVQMLGDVDEVTKSALMTRCRAFVMPSRESRRPPLFEGFGIVYIEAAMAGRPSLAGASGGVADAVVHGQTGLLVDPTSIADVASAALRLLDDPALADALGERARERALRDHTWSVAIERMERCMETLL